MEQLEKKVPVSELKSYFLSKWREGNVLWNFQSQGSQDVKIALRETVEDKAEFKKIAQKIISDYNLSKKPIDSIPRYVMDWREDYFNRNTYYKSDLTTFGKSDYWQRGGLTL
jgi:hypothetical protein